jgi:hypothetical protein
VNWPALTTWNLAVALRSGANLLVIEGYDFDGNVLFTDQITVTTSNGSEPTRILINEWMASNNGALVDPADNDFDDWFELFNPNSFAVDLSGWNLADNIDLGGARWAIPTGTSIPANGYLLVWADGETNQNTLTNIDLHANFRLSQSGEIIALFNPQGQLVDSVEFGAQTNNVSQGRSPDGGTNYVFFSSPSPRGPILAARPTLATPVRVSAGTLRITWNSEAGRTYKLQSSDDLSSGSWSDLPPVTGSGGTISVDVPSSAARQVFFRVQVVTP